MAAKPVQISLDSELLRRIDRDPEARQKGRSALVRSAVLLYLEAKRRKEIDRQILKAFVGRAADDLSGEIEGLMAAQAWPKR
jgi:metal-responsive CopG/Arc/MetJ family transcriptional regulator